MKKKIIPWLLSFCLALAGCGAAQPVEMNCGAVENGIYENQALGLTVPIPTGWYVGGEEEAAEPGLVESLESFLGEEGLYPCFWLSYGEGTGVESYPAVRLFVRELAPIASYVTNANEYLAQVQIALDNDTIDAFYEDVFATTVGGKSFQNLFVELTDINEDVIYQNYLAAEADGYLIVIVLSYLDFDQSEQAFNVLDRFSFQ